MIKKARAAISFGQVLTGGGLILKVLQLILSAAGIDSAASAVPTLAVTCLAVGGLAVFAVERRGLTSVFAVLSAVLWLGSLILSRYGGFFGTAVYFASYISFALMLFTLKRPLAKAAACAAAVLLAVMALYLWGVLPFGAAGATAVLCLINIIMCVGLFL